MISIENLESLKALLAEPSKCVIVTHPRPDADAIGSSLGWKHYLEKVGHSVTFISPTHYTDNLKWIKGTEAIIDFELEKHKSIATAALAAADVIFCLDFNAIGRLEELGTLIASSNAAKIIIDHHLEPEDFALITISDSSYAATSEMIYDVIKGMGDQNKIDAAIAENLYAGLVSDTGFFQHPNTTPNAHSVAAALVTQGARPDYVSDCINNVFDQRRMHYLGHALLNKLKVVKDGRVAYISIGQSDARMFNLQIGDNEGLVNYPFKIHGVQLVALFSEEGPKVKISLRSKGDIDVNNFSRKYWEGGGHKNAAGGKSMIGMEATEKRFEELVGELF